MIRYEKSDVTNWLLKYFRVNQINGNEVNFPCPFCEHKSFYFNVAKSLGFCHHDECHRGVSLDDLIDIIGSEPEAFSGPIKAIVKQKETQQVSLPAYAKNIIESNDLWAIECLKQRNVTPQQIKRFNIHSSETMIYVPVYSDGQLVQYVGRSVDRSLPTEQGFKKTGRRYYYADGAHISSYLFGWDECKLWKELVLVENTFNSIWLRDLFHCTTNFGSHLSKTQINLITKSNVRSVVLLWDEGAQLRSQQAVHSLKSAGVRAIAAQIKGQPDDFTIDVLNPIIDHARKMILSRPEVNYVA